jgi:hypothetical protein
VLNRESNTAADSDRNELIGPDELVDR